MSSPIALQTNSILQVPFNNYPKDFTFIVNKQKYKTSKFFADILSPKISRIHQTDFTQDEYYISTNNQGNFDKILQLQNFEKIDINNDELPFISEIIEILGMNSIDIIIPNTDISITNVIELLKKHEQNPLFYSKKLREEIDFLSSHFYELKEEQEKEIVLLRDITIESIICNKKLKLSNEDQLLNLLNEICSKHDDLWHLYSEVIFTNVSAKSISEFIQLFDSCKMTHETWNSLAKRLMVEIKSNMNENSERYHQNTKNNKQAGREIEYTNKNLDGIFSYFRKESNIDEEVKVTYSSMRGGDLKTLLDINDQSNYFYTCSQSNAWVCFEFTKHQIIPSCYSLRTNSNGERGPHLKNWVIEGSNDKSKWITIDEQSNNSYLNGRYFVHTFQISQKQNLNEKGFKFIRIRQTGLNWNSTCFLELCSTEFYGKII